LQIHAPRHISESDASAIDVSKEKTKKCFSKYRVSLMFQESVSRPKLDLLPI